MAVKAQSRGWRINCAMYISRRAMAFISISVFCFLAVTPQPLSRLHAAENDAPPLARPLEIVNAWARLARDNKRSATVYFEIVNRGDTPDSLVSVWTPIADKAAMAVPHWKGLRMTFRRIETIAVPAGGKVTLRPGGYQIDIVDLSHELHPGQTIPLEVRFARAGRMEVRAEILNKLLPDYAHRGRDAGAPE